MTFPIDQFTSLPPAAGSQQRPAAEDSYGRSQDRSDQAAFDNRSDSAQSARDLATQRSDFQRHLDDQARDDYAGDELTNSERAGATDYPEERANAAPQEDPDRHDPVNDTEDEGNHGHTVSEVAKDTDSANATGQTTDTLAASGSPAPLSATQDQTASRGATVRAVANTKASAIETSGDSTTGEASDGGTPPPVSTTATADTPVPVTPETTTVQTAPVAQDGEPPASASQDPEEGTAPAPKPQATTEQTGQQASHATEQKSGDTGSTTEQEVNAVTASTEPETTTQNPANPSTNMFNENAQKTEDADRPGWGAQNAPRSEQGTLASQLKSGNGEAATDPSGTTPSDTPATVAPDNISPEVSEEGETTLVEALAPDQGAKDPAPVSHEVFPGAPATTGETPFGNADAAKAGRAATAPVTAATDIPAGTSTPAPGTNRAAAAQANAQTNAQSPAQTGASGSGGASGDATAQASANAKAAANASPVGIAKAMTSGQGSMPLGTAPSAEEVEVALAGIDKRGTRLGTKSDVNGANPAAESTTKSKASGQSASGIAGQASQNTAAQAQPSPSGQASQFGQATQSGQAAMAPAMPDLSALAGGTDMTMARGGATMEVDPATGALHLTGTGSAKMAGPNLSEVTMQFSRARMIQTPAKDIAVQIAKHLSGGVNRFDIRISPPEMGRIEVRLEIAESGKVTAHLVADKPETLDLLQKDRATLEKALAEAGLDTDANSLEFSMREGKEDTDQEFKNHGLEVADEASDAQGVGPMETLADLEVSAYGFDIIRMKRLDISI